MKRLNQAKSLDFPVFSLTSTRKGPRNYDGEMSWNCIGIRPFVFTGRIIRFTKFRIFVIIKEHNEFSESCFSELWYNLSILQKHWFHRLYRLLWEFYFYDISETFLLFGKFIYFSGKYSLFGMLKYLIISVCYTIFEDEKVVNQYRLK